MTTFVIAGGGLAGAKGAEALRDQGFDGDIVLVADESHRPYERPPLSKDFLAGKAERDSVFVHDENWYAEHNVDLRLGVAATAIDRAAHQVRLADGSSVEYSKLLLATGSSPRRFPGAEDALYLRRIGDSERIKSVIASSSRLIVIGAGWIGLEATAAARNAGVEVTVLESAELPLLAAIGPEVAQVYADLHRAHDVDLRFGVEVDQVNFKSVGLVDGTVLDADAVLIGIGASPNVDLAKKAGLDVDNGVLVDAGLRTSDPDIFAAGDIANATHPLLGRRIRVEHWANALNQPAVAATNMLDGDATYDELPYFYTDQYDLGMEYIGDITGYDRVVFRGDVPGREFIAFWLKDNRVLAGMNVNIWDVVDPIKQLIRSGKQIDPDRLANPEVSLEDH
ncbi:3-phenylpropionate/trans-cinnamate dioxygenase ferredoxin reductase subunit [Kibdelosporangium banguiense]|uniref:3-phenylpropionate/trans-cinnamate dioxygenase ferredoxin reductase subunit n=1 Tax=Kibdelosporangium banguiense TaxID=1365924 RepID=A0ABS4U330_9PSEU|nr:FAD-dependent oxidoreductase [Kibdelosporangium banguiense]MBP2331077.1 3-phenylpropionate/trans-cinnamate dioxygenase ferredoxin reductase subunit [Kibdelosporangium banguiense]